MPEQDFYADPSIYDILHAAGTANEVDGLERIALRFAPGRPERHVWLEPACGTGRYLRVAAARGRRVIGLDLSEAMIAYAEARLRSRGLSRRARLLVADMEDFDAGAGVAHFAFNTINSVRHLPSDRALTRHLDAVARALVPAGAYAVGLSLSDYEHEFPSEDVWEGARGRCRVRQVVQYLPPEHRRRAERVISHVSIERPRAEEHFTSTYELRAYDAAQWRAAVGASSLSIEASVDEHGRDVDVPRSGYAIFVLRAPGNPTRSAPAG